LASKLKDFGKHKSFFFIGIGGAGMSAIAVVLKGMGFTISGSDIKESGYTENLIRKGIQVFTGHNSKNIIGFDAVIISAAIRSENIEYKAARNAGTSIYSRSDALAWILNQKKGIAVAGTHGKTTTTSMISYIFKEAGLDPTIIIGGELNELGTNASFGEGDYIIAEACESDGSFLKYNPFISIVTNIEEDHLDFYKDFEEIRKSFVNFLNNTKENGLIIINGDDIDKDMLDGLKDDKKIITFGLADKNDIFAYDIRTVCQGIAFKIRIADKIYDVKLRIPGIHNVKNCLASLSCAHVLNLDMNRCIEIIESFTGVKRRFEARGRFNDSLVVDDYAHHPTEIKATLEAAESLSSEKIITVFQPHRYSRLRAILDKFNNCFEKTDILIITEVYASGENPIPGVSGKLLIDYLSENNFSKKLVYLPKINDIVEYLKQKIRKDNLIILMGAGDITRVSDSLLGS
jgi:UDP-N-acetylmuramate--alanine ligase